LAFSQYAFLLGVLLVQCDHVYFTFYRNWPSRRRLDDIPSVKCASSGSAWFWFGNDHVVGEYGPIYNFYPYGWAQLYFYGHQHEDCRHVFQQAAAYCLGAIYDGNLGLAYISCTVWSSAVADI